MSEFFEPPPRPVAPEPERYRTPPWFGAPPGALTLVCEWPAMGIPLTSVELDAQLILDAAARAEVIFSDEHLREPPDEDDGADR